jgi:hypothetical protein
MALSRNALTVVVVLGVLIVAGATWALLSSRAAPGHPAAAAKAPTSQPAIPPSIDLVAKATIALQSCNLPSPPASPDGASASLNQMLAARNEFQAYDGATNAYLACVDGAVQRVAQESAKVASQSDLDSLHRFGLRAHNTAIDQEQGYVDQFNAQLRTYKTKHPHT